LSDAYDQHLASVHEGWATPPDLVRAAVAEVTTSAVVDLRRIVAGEQNEVLDVTLDGAPSLIVRISHQGPAAHDREAWAIDQCESRGVPSPRIHARRTLTVDGEERSLLVMTKVPGERLRDLDPADLDVRRLLREVGAWLRRLHTIPVRGHGYLDGHGVGEHATFDDWLADLTGPAAAFEDAGAAVGLEAATVRVWLDEIVRALRTAPPRITLIHNDLLATHVLVGDDGGLSGIIDFGEVAAEPAANDLAKWDVVEGERLPVAWIREGYGEGAATEASADASRALWRANALWRLRWYHETGYPEGVAEARDRLLEGPSR
jgi:Ser/Thr protein kinase RdoA (MazF antagonist)